MNRPMVDNDPSLFNALCMFLISLIVALIAVYLIFSLRNRPLSPSPLDIAKERYSRGEISRDEFAEIKKVLS